MLWEAATLCFFGFQRTGEVVVPMDGAFDPRRHLAYGDVRIDDCQNPQNLEVTIKASKTDPYRKGVDIYVGRAPGGLYPVAAVTDYMVRCGPQPGPFVTFESGRYLTRERLMKAIREALTAMGLDYSLFAGHSFRIGAVTVAAQDGVQEYFIKMMGRWASTAYLCYIRTPREVFCGVAVVMAGQMEGQKDGYRRS